MPPRIASLEIGKNLPQGKRYSTKTAEKKTRAKSDVKLHNYLFRVIGTIPEWKRYQQHFDFMIFFCPLLITATWKNWIG